MSSDDTGDASLVQQQPVIMTRAQAIERTMDPMAQVKMILEAGAALDKLTEFALAMTDERHWDDMGGNPRLNKVGAHLLAKKLGLRVETHGTTLMEEGTDADGPFFVYQCTGQISHPLSPATMSCQGTCDSRNQFHTTRYELVYDADGKKIWETYEYWDKRQKKKVQRRRPKKEKIRLQAHQVQRTFIAQQAQTLCKVKGITEFLSLERLTWEMVEQATQARKEGAAAVNFKDNTEGKKPQPGADQPPAPPRERKPTDLASPPERLAVWKRFQEHMGWTDADLPDDAGKRFYAWVEAAVGAENAERSRWTVGTCQKLMELKLPAREADAPPEEPPAPPEPAEPEPDQPPEEPDQGDPPADDPGTPAG